MILLKTTLFIAIFGFLEASKCGHMEANYFTGIGVIRSHIHTGDYHNNAVCKWQLGTPCGMTKVRIRFSMFNLEQHASCKYDYLMLQYRKSELQNGSRTAVTKVTQERYCGSDKPAEQLIEAKGQITILFRSDDSNGGSGFVMHFQYLHPNKEGGCLPLKQEADDIFSITPNTVENYQHNLNCKWSLCTPPNSEYTHMKVQFKYFRVESEKYCRNDNLHLHYTTVRGDVVNSIICGEQLPVPSVINEVEKIDISFTTNNKTSRGGFLILLTLVKDIKPPNCPVVHPQPYDNFVLSNLIKAKHPNCVIPGPPKFQFLTVSFSYFKMSNNTNTSNSNYCTGNYVILSYSPDNSTLTKSAKLCGNSPPDDVTSFGPVLISIHQHDPEPADFILSYKYAYFEGFDKKQQRISAVTRNSSSHAKLSDAAANCKLSKNCQYMWLYMVFATILGCLITISISKVRNEYLNVQRMVGKDAEDDIGGVDNSTYNLT